MWYRLTADDGRDKLVNMAFAYEIEERSDAQKGCRIRIAAPGDEGNREGTRVVLVTERLEELAAIVRPATIRSESFVFRWLGRPVAAFFARSWA